MTPLQQYLNKINLPKVKTDVEVKPSTSLFTLVVGSIIMIYLLFGIKPKKRKK